MKMGIWFSMPGAAVIAAMMAVSGCQPGDIKTAETVAAAESEQFKGGA